MTPRDGTGAGERLPHEFAASGRAASLGGLPCLHCGRAADEIFDDHECPARLRAALDHARNEGRREALAPECAAFLDSIEHHLRRSLTIFSDVDAPAMRWATAGYPRTRSTP